MREAQAIRALAPLGPPADECVQGAGSQATKLWRHHDGPGQLP